MARHHLVPKFLLRRWAHPDSGLIEVFDRRGWKLAREDPSRFAAIDDFNTVLDGAGDPDDWIESQLLAGLDDAAARALRQVDVLPLPKSMARQAAVKGWHPTQFLSPKLTTAVAMWVAAQAVRGAAFRDAVTGATTRDMQELLTSKNTKELASATDEAEKVRLRELAGVRIVGAKFDQNTLPELMAHLIVRLGEVLYGEYAWAVQRWENPALAIGDDPVLLLNIKDPARSGSYSQVATRGPEPLSLWLPPQETVRRALAAMRGQHLIVMPLGPRHLLTLSPTTRMKPGRYDVPAEMARAYNSIMVGASVRWVASRPPDGAGEPPAGPIERGAELGLVAMRADAERRQRARDAA